MFGSFSQRNKFEPVKTQIQTESMDEDLRNGLWNVLEHHCWSKLAERVGPADFLTRSSTRGEVFFKRLWHDHLKRSLDTIPPNSTLTLASVRQLFFGWQWNKVYDFVEFTADRFPLGSNEKARLTDGCNRILERELAGYRFVSGLITPIVSREEIEAVEQAVNRRDDFAPARDHLGRALALFSSRTSPDYRNSVKESILGVEAACQLIAGETKATLGQALKQLQIHPCLRDAFSKLYGYTNDAEGIRHALLDEPALTSDDAKFMLVCCSAFVNYLAASTVRK